MKPPDTLLYMEEKEVGINAEWDKLTKVLVHEPGYELHIAKRSKKHSLFDIRPGQTLNIDEAIKEHRRLVEKLKDLGVKVYHTKEEFFKNPDSKKYVKTAYMKSEILANLEYISNGKTKIQDIEKGIEDDIDIAFDCVSSHNTDQGKEYLWQEVLTCISSIPDFNYEDVGDPEGRKGAIFQSRPLNNYMFQRDQQFVTAKGYVMCNMKKPARKGEPVINEFVLEQIIGQGPVHRISDENTIEGGEYIPAGEFALIGYGSRTSPGAIDELLEEDVVGFDKVIAVKTPKVEDLKETSTDDTERLEDMEIMHLDTYFNYAGKNAVVVQKEVAEKTELTEHSRKGCAYTEIGAPVINNKKCNTLMDLIKAKKYEVIELTPDEQRYYGANIMTIDENTVIVPDMEKNSNGLIKNEDYLQKFYDAGLKKENVHVVKMKELTKVYGCAHCMTCAIERAAYAEA